MPVSGEKADTLVAALWPCLFSLPFLFSLAFFSLFLSRVFLLCSLAGPAAALADSGKAPIFSRTEDACLTGAAVVCQNNELLT